MAGTFKLLAEEAHCSHHMFWMNGCSECSCAVTLKEHETKLAKANSIHPLIIEPGAPTPRIQLIRQQMARMLAVFFAKAKNNAARAAKKKANELSKAEKQEGVIDHDGQAEIALAAYLAIEWNELVSVVTTDLLAAAQTGAIIGLMQAQNTSDIIKDSVLDKTKEYARNRAAEMVGLQYVGKTLVEDPDAKYVIAQTTKDDLQDIVEKSLTIEELEEHIKMAGTFSDLRAQMIAKNEVAMAQSFGHLRAWKETKAVEHVNIVLSSNHKVYDLCDEHAKGSPYLINEAPLIPSHPYCACSIQSAS